ncbi:MAG: efflux RND transporter periplasmic adaptor subunit, partial [Vicinamibacterales bacterium]
TGRAGRGGRGAGGPAVNIETTTLKRVSIPRKVDLSGTLLSPDQARVSSEAAGIIREVVVQLGSEVKPGDVLVRLAPREIEIALERAESALRQTEAQLGIDGSAGKQPPPDEQIASVRQATANRDDARATMARAELLSSQGIMSKVDYQTAETRLKVADANYQAALDNVRSLKAVLQDRRASYELAQKKLGDAVIKAPVAGSVAERLVQPGEFIRENTVVVTVVQMNPLKFKTAVQEKNAALIKTGQAVDFAVEAFPGRVFKGKVAYISPAVDQTTRTFVVEALVENNDRSLKPGFFAKGTVLTHTDDDVIAAPEATVSTLAGVSTVFVIEDGKARQQQVALGERQGDLVEILSGLKGNETIATSNLNQLATGTNVRVAGQGADAGAPASSGGGGGGNGRRGGGRGRGQTTNNQGGRQ